MLNKKKLFILCLLCSAILLLYEIVRYKNFTMIYSTSEYVSLEKNTFELNTKDPTNIKEKNRITTTNKKRYNNISVKNRTESLKTKMKYILQWTSPNSSPFVYMGKGQKGFIDWKCPHTNCFVTSDRQLLGDYTKFDVIAFAGPEVRYMSVDGLPQKRSPNQKFVFGTIESSHYYPVCSDIFENYFNWTWTFKLDSEVQWGYFAIRDMENRWIGPKKIMHWMKKEDMAPVADELKKKLRKKSKAAAWFVSNCHSPSNREKFVEELKTELTLYNLTVDVYGNCGPMKCPRDNEDECDIMVENDYYFYLAFENSFSEDYVTEKLLRGLRYNTIPIVYGGANYTRYMPDGIYLNARELGPKKLAEKMNELINNPDQYSEYFRWKKHFSYHGLHESTETNEYCRFCTTLNDEEMVKKITVYEKFKEWWNRPGAC